MTLKMQSDYLLIKLHDSIEETNSGIALVKTEVPCIGTVIAAGPGKYDSRGNFIECPLKGSEVVIFGKASLHQEIEHEGVKYNIMRYDEIFAEQK